jgi:hypothetical protein
MFDKKHGSYGAFRMKNFAIFRLLGQGGFPVPQHTNAKDTTLLIAVARPAEKIRRHFYIHTQNQASYDYHFLMRQKWHLKNLCESYQLFLIFYPVHNRVA